MSVTAELKETKKDAGKSDPEFLSLHDRIIRALGRSVANAAEQLNAFTQGQLDDWEAPRVRLLISLAHMGPKILPLIEQERVATIARHPECPVCGGARGEHFAHECPMMLEYPPGEYVFDYRTRSVYKWEELRGPMPGNVDPLPHLSNLQSLQQWWKEQGHKEGFSPEQLARWEAGAIDNDNRRAWLQRNGAPDTG